MRDKRAKRVVVKSYIVISRWPDRVIAKREDSWLLKSGCGSSHRYARCFSTTAEIGRERKGKHGQLGLGIRREKDGHRTEAGIFI